MLGITLNLARGLEFPPNLHVKGQLVTAIVIGQNVSDAFLGLYYAAQETVWMTFLLLAS